MSYLSTRVRVRVFRGFLVLLIFVAAVGVTHAQSVVRVEEDWELVVAEPDPNTDAPQITCVISPYGNVESLHAVFEVNQQSLQVHDAGGLQLQVWDGDVSLSDRRFPNGAVLAQPGEIVRWTQSVELDDGTLTFEITDGTSTTWGNFGGQGYLKASVDTTLTDLNGYNPETSVANSGIGYAENRVQSLVLKRIRIHTSMGEQIELTEPRIIHSRQ